MKYLLDTDYVSFLQRSNCAEFTPLIPPRIGGLGGQRF
jgi:hypothetical protein